MAKFFVVTDGFGETVGCFMSQREAMAQGRENAKRNEDGFRVEMVEVAVNSESICKMLAQRGGYAIDTRVVFDSGE